MWLACTWRLGFELNPPYSFSADRNIPITQSIGNYQVPNVGIECLDRFVILVHDLTFDITWFSPFLGHCPSWVAGYTHRDTASFNSLALTFSLMFASDSICLSTYSNVSCDCWAKAWRPNVALFSYNSNKVQSDKNPNSFNCWPRSGCPDRLSALISVSAGTPPPPLLCVYLRTHEPSRPRSVSCVCLLIRNLFHVSSRFLTHHVYFVYPPLRL